MAVVALLRGRAPWWCACLGALALALAGCASTSAPASSAVTVAGSTLDVYAAQPPGGADSAAGDVLAAERLALRQASGRAGSFAVRLIGVHGHEVSASARTAIQDKQAIAYLGELAPGTSGVSLQITNQVGLLQVSPIDTAVYLTQSTPAVGDSPNHFYPAKSTFHYTFARVVGTTAGEANALARDMHALRVAKLYVASDGTSYGASIADEVRSAARAQGITLAPGPSGADGVFYGGLNGPEATRALDRLAASSPAAKLFAPSSLYDNTFVSGLSSIAQRDLYVSAPGVALPGQNAAARAFTVAFRSAYGHVPEPQAIYGYETMSALLAVLKGLGANANSRAQVVAGFRGLRNRQSALGTYSLQHGDTDLASFVIARAAGGRLVPRSTP